MILNILGKIILFLLVLGKDIVVESKPTTEEDGQCGYASCPGTKKGFVNVHIMSHSHDDVGWLKTLDQYYFGSNPGIQEAGVQYIIDSVVLQLNSDKKKRFIYVETAFFWKWWERQPEHMRRVVRKLVANGQLEFIGGGWSMHDEGATHYQSIIDGFSWGFRKLNDTFGQCGAPRIGWQIDPFGHSRETASIMARLGFDALFFGRLDYRDKNKRMANKEMEMVWEASPNLGVDADLFTGVLYNGYYPPDGFCLDLLCEEEPINDDKKSPDFNAFSKALDFMKQTDQIASVYKAPHIAVTMGGDFHYQAAGAFFLNLDALIKEVNSLQKTHNYHLLYSTPSCYAKALNDEGLEWPTKQDDFFPYASETHAYWNGYFTSRPALKRYERFSNNFLQVVKQLSSLAHLKDKEGGDLDVLREAMGVMQHHDAVSGTEKQNVANDYARLLSAGFDEGTLSTQAALNKLMAKSPSSEQVVVENCLLLNISQCEISETSKTFVVTLYNPLSRSVSRYVRLPVPSCTSYAVYDAQGKEVKSQLTLIPDAVKKIPGRTSQAAFELVYLVPHLPPLGYKSYYILSQNGSCEAVQSENLVDGKHVVIGFKDHLQLTFDGTTGLPVKLHVPGYANTKFEQNFYYYNSYAGTNEDPDDRSSGAYIFRPASNSLNTISSTSSSKYYKGPLVHEVHQQMSDWASQVIRIFKGEDNLEFNWIIGPVPIEDYNGKDVVSLYKVDMKTDSTFYTDSNGREMLQRILDYRSTFNITPEEPVAANYYPINTRLTLKDDVKQLSVMTDRAQGGTSMQDGQLELMLHRRLLNDDGMGVGEALNETAYGTGLVVRGTHYLTGGSVVNQSAADRRLVQQRVLDTWTFFTPTDLSLAQWQDQYNMEYSGLTSVLPDNVQILTLEPWRDNTFLIRLEHILEKDDDPDASQPVTVDIQNIFSPFTVTWMRETSLGGNRWQDDVYRMEWRKEGASKIRSTKTQKSVDSGDSMSVTLNPMDIKTFVIEVSFSY